MPKLPRKKSLKKERSVPYEVRTAIPLTRSRTSLLNFSEHRTAFSELHKLDELRKALEEEDTARRRTVVTRHMTKSKEKKKELQTILNNPKLQKCIQERLSLTSTKMCKQSKLSIEPKPVRTSTRGKVSRKRSVSTSVAKSSSSPYIHAQNQSEELGTGDCSIELNENIEDQNLNNGEILQETVTDQGLGTGLESETLEISRNVERQNAESDLEQCSYQMNETGDDPNNSSPALEQESSIEQTSETNSESDNVRNSHNLEPENVHQNVEELSSNEWQGYFKKFIGSVVESTSSFFRNVFEDFLQG